NAVCGCDRAAVLELVAELSKYLLEHCKEHQYVCLAAGVAHQTDPPDLSLERSEPGADFDVETIQQSFSHGCVIDARGDPHRIELRQRVPSLRRVFDPNRR